MCIYIDTQFENNWILPRHSVVTISLHMDALGNASCKK